MDTDLTPEQAKEHGKHGHTGCPFCLSDDTSYENMDFESGTVWQRAECLTCGRLWSEVYTLTHIEARDLGPSHAELGESHPIA